MSELRLERLELDFDGRHYRLAYNFNTVAELEALNENFGDTLQLNNAHKNTLLMTTAMLNSYAQEMVDTDPEWADVHYTPRKVGAMLPASGADFNAFAKRLWSIVRNGGGDVSTMDTKKA